MSELFRIISDGSCDLPVAFAEEKNVSIVPFYVSFDDEHYERENVEIQIRDFYQQMVDRKGVYPKSSMPATQDYVDAFLPWVEKKVPVVCICITTKFSGSMQSALNAKNIILEDHPDARIEVIDSTINTVLQGLYVQEAIRLRDAGYGFEDAVKRLEEIKSTGRIFFTVGDMEYLQHGGRIGKVASVAGSVLGIRPIITLKRVRSTRPVSGAAESVPLKSLWSCCSIILRRISIRPRMSASVSDMAMISKRGQIARGSRWRSCTRED